MLFGSPFSSAWKRARSQVGENGPHFFSQSSPEPDPPARKRPDSSSGHEPPLEADA
jgi:hypothetical protein